MADFFSKSPADRQAVLDAHPQLKSRLETRPDRRTGLSSGARRH
ncbi:hypothetical protein ACNJ7E_20960 [Rhodococcus sp. NM-2]|nr:hypothetical protein [Rhodococcus sp. IEGM 1305]MDI9952862.1 hypothetical protein [Rhodococcus sp. IEGM 1305]